MKTPLTPTDRDALSRAIAAARAEDAGRRKQIDSMLADEPWESVAVFAASCAQSKSLGLMPWQLPPFRASLADLDQPPGDPSGRRESAELLQRLLRAGLSPFEPDPLRAIEQAEAKGVGGCQL
jgi:hypothetical protein